LDWLILAKKVGTVNQGIAQQFPLEPDLIELKVN